MMYRPLSGHVTAHFSSIGDRTLPRLVSVADFERLSGAAESAHPGLCMEDLARQVGIPPAP